MFVVKWRNALHSGRAHDERFEGRRYATREEAEIVAQRFRAKDRVCEYWVEEVSDG